MPSPPPPPPPPAGVLDNTTLPPAPVFPSVVPLPPGETCWAVMHFEETTDRSHNRTLDGAQRMTRTFQVLTCQPLVGSTVVARFDQAKGDYFFPAGHPDARFNGNPQRRVPQPGDRYVELDRNWSVIHTNENVVCVEVRLQQMDPDNLQNWTVVAEYAGESDPLAQPPDVRWGHVPYQAHLIEEVEALDPNPAPRPILNSAGDPFAEGVLAPHDRFQVSIARNVLTWDPTKVPDFHNSVNAAIFLAAQHPPGFAVGTCKLKLSADRVRRSGNRDFYWRVHALVEINPKGWDARVRDSGFNYYPGGVAASKQPVGRHPRFFGGMGPGTPQLLKPNGDLASPTDPVPAPLVFRRYKRKDWGALWFLEY